MIQMFELWTLALFTGSWWGRVGQQKHYRRGEAPPGATMMVSDMRFALSETMTAKSFVHVNSVSFSPT